jgi:hypothetical protein
MYALHTLPCSSTPYILSHHDPNRYSSANVAKLMLYRAPQPQRSQHYTDMQERIEITRKIFYQRDEAFRLFQSEQEERRYVTPLLHPACYHILLQKKKCHCPTSMCSQKCSSRKSSKDIKRHATPERKQMYTKRAMRQAAWIIRKSLDEPRSIAERCTRCRYLGQGEKRLSGNLERKRRIWV